eukprot:3611788-Pleurochrysis_carterae.AAC.1
MGGGSVRWLAETLKNRAKKRGARAAKETKAQVESQASTETENMAREDKDCRVAEACMCVRTCCCAARTHPCASESMRACMLLSQSMRSRVIFFSVEV